MKKTLAILLALVMVLTFSMIFAGYAQRKQK